MDVGNKSGKYRTFYFSFDLLIRHSIFDLQASHADAADVAFIAAADAA